MSLAMDEIFAIRYVAYLSCYNFLGSMERLLYLVTYSLILYERCRECYKWNNNEKFEFRDNLQFKNSSPIHQTSYPICPNLKKTEALKTQYEQSMQELKMLYGSLSQKAFMGKPNLSEEEEVQLMIADIVKTCLIKRVINGNRQSHIFNHNIAYRRCYRTLEKRLYGFVTIYLYYSFPTSNRSLTVWLRVSAVFLL